MSWDWDPHKTTTIVLTGTGYQFKWSCDNCGGVSKEEYSSLKLLWQNWIRHVTESHNTRSQDTKGWSVPL